MTDSMTGAIAIFDIGKTNIKLSLVDDHGRELAARRRSNAVRRDGPYPHHDVAAIEAWLLAMLRELSMVATIRAIVPVTHGATAALVDDDGLVLPVPDYEHDFPLPAGCAPYAALRPPFSQTCSPQLGLGLNLGRQLHWLQSSFPEAFARGRRLLMYPQYWSWRLCGVAASELTSLGCHTDLWQPGPRAYSSLVTRCGWSSLMPPLRGAWEALGKIRPALAQEAGLPPDCRVLCGIHDSNASLLRYLAGGPSAPRIVLSTGTWVIAAALDGDLQRLQEHQDMLANISVDGDAVACMRYMGGREFAELAGDITHAGPCGNAELQALVDAGIMALPCFSGCGGPFAGDPGEIIGALPAGGAARYALATLYCVLMADYCLDQLQAAGDVVIEGSFTANPCFAPLLAALSGRGVYCSDDGSGTTIGGWLLHDWKKPRRNAPLPAPHQATPLPLRGLRAYRDQWRATLLARAAQDTMPAMH